MVSYFCMINTEYAVFKRTKNIRDHFHYLLRHHAFYGIPVGYEIDKDPLQKCVDNTGRNSHCTWPAGVSCKANTLRKAGKSQISKIKFQIISNKQKKLPIEFGLSLLI